MEQCWLCNIRFPNLTSLHKHLTSKIHTRCRVVCPWCLGQERTFTRVNDLKAHCGVAHPETKHLSPTFFSSANGFYMARFPADYRRIVNLGRWDSEDAFEARELMLEWCKSQNKAEMVKMHWQSGWAEAMSQRPAKRTYAESEASDLGDGPDIELGESNTKSRKVVIKRKEEGDKKKDRKSEQEEDTQQESRKQKEESWIKRQETKESGRKKEGRSEQEEDIQKESRKQKEEQISKRQETKESDRKNYRSEPEEDAERESRKQKEEQISKRQEIKESDRKKYRSEPEEDAERESRKQKEEQISKRQETKESDRKKEGRSEQEQSAERESRKQKEESITKKQGTKMSDKKQDRSEQEEEGESKKPEESVEVECKKEEEFKEVVVLLSGTVEEDLDYSDSSSEDEEMTPTGDLKSRKKEIRSELSSIKTQIEQKDEEIEKLNQGIKDKKDLQTKAVEILTIGAMPLCPPARRHWTRKNSLDLEVGGATIQWPPKDFETMNPDQKLLSWEYISMRIEEQAHGKFPTKSRQLLLDTYNFLALPGTRKASDSQDRATRKIRYYNYQLVRQVARGEPTSEETKAVLETLINLSGGSKRSLAEVMARQMDVARFPLRLEKE